MEKPNISTLLKTLTMIHSFLLGGVLLIAYLLFPEMKSYNVVFEEGDFIAYIVPAALFLAIFIGDFLFKKKVNEVKDRKELTEKFGTYQTAILMRIAPLEAVALFSIIQLGNTSNALFLYVSAVAVLYMFYLFPTKGRIAKELQLSNSDRRLLDNH
jgi:hypothetical protein